VQVDAFSNDATPFGSVSAFPGAAVVNCLAVAPSASALGIGSADTGIAGVNVSAVSAAASLPGFIVGPWQRYTVPERETLFTVPERETLFTVPDLYDG